MGGLGEEKAGGKGIIEVKPTSCWQDDLKSTETDGTDKTENVMGKRRRERRYKKKIASFSSLFHLPSPLPFSSAKKGRRVLEKTCVTVLIKEIFEKKKAKLFPFLEEFSKKKSFSSFRNIFRSLSSDVFSFFPFFFFFLIFLYQRWPFIGIKNFFLFYFKRFCIPCLPSLFSSQFFCFTIHYNKINLVLRKKS